MPIQVSTSHPVSTSDSKKQKIEWPETYEGILATFERRGYSLQEAKYYMSECNNLPDEALKRLKLKYKASV